MDRRALQDYLDSLLDCARIKDYCPNGLQVEGRAAVQRILCGVTASLALIEEAIAIHADAIMVHHGYFWRGEDGRIQGTRKQRLAALLKHDINLFAFHLPLDVHPQLGNNAQLGRVMDWAVTARIGEQNLISLGSPSAPSRVGEIHTALCQRLGREAMLVGDARKPVERIAWCTGGAQGFLEQAITAGADLYVSGEISEQTWHLARESGVAYIAAGHHATERFGIQALAEHLRVEQGLDARFVDLPNPV